VKPHIYLWIVVSVSLLSTNPTQRVFLVLTGYIVASLLIKHVA